MKREYKEKILEYTPNMQPINRCKKDSVALCFCTSNKYAPFCGITIQSIIENSSRDRFYEIIILEHDMDIRNKKKLFSLIDKEDNFSIRIMNMKNGLEELRVNTWAHFSVVACFKLFLMANIFCQYDKMLCLDTDLICKEDVAKLFDIDIEQYYMAAVNDVIMRSHVKNEKMSGGYSPRMNVSEYIRDYLGFENDEKYYNTGVALLNLKRFREEDFYRIAIKKLKIKGYTYQEQDVLNELCSKKILDLELKWNVVGLDNIEEISENQTEEMKKEYLESLDNPYILHFAGGIKPWSHNDIPYSEDFFACAKHTPWYEKIIVELSLNYAKYLYNLSLQSIQGKKKKLWVFLDIVLPPFSVRRKIVNILFPKKSYRRERLRIIYNYVVNKQYRQHVNERRIEWKNNGIYRKAINRRIKKNYILFDSKNGTDLAGNIFRIMQEMSNAENEYNYKLFLTYTDNSLERIKKILTRYQLSDIELVKWKSKKFYGLLGVSKYIITDLYVPSEYIKRKDQVLVSTAHGTPIKVMGKDCNTELQGHLQRTHTLADYQTFPSDYMKEKLFSGFMEDQLFDGQALKSGYARNVIFFDEERRKQVRNELQYNNKNVYAYLPTFRGIAGNFHNESQADYLSSVFETLDKLLEDDDLLIVKMHNFAKCQIDYSGYKHIQNFPQDYEVYDVLNATDGLISDYSSVFFDYANLRKKIILFQYDYEQYMRERGCYLKWDELPFPVVFDVEGLYKEMKTPIGYDDTEFLNKYCQYDNPNAVKNICETIFNGKNLCDVFDRTRNEKKNLFIHIGDMKLNNKNTYYIYEYLKSMNLDEFNVFLFFYEYDLFDRAYLLREFDKEVSYFSYLSTPELKEREFYQYVFCNKEKKSKVINKVAKRESKKMFEDVDIDVYLDLSGENEMVAKAAEYLVCKKIIIKCNDTNIDYCKYDNVISYGEEENELKEGFSSNVIRYNANVIEKVIKSVI